jgi:hypothetical protein
MLFGKFKCPVILTLKINAMGPLQPDILKSAGGLKLFILLLSLVAVNRSANAQLDSIQGRNHSETEKKAQEAQVAGWQNDSKHYAGLLPTFFEKDSAKGSQYLSLNWMRGVVELADHRIMPKRNEYLFFNFDKINNRLYLINQAGTIWSYPIDSVTGFTLGDGDKIYSFEKVSVISDRFFLSPVIKSEKGYSLYKRLITKIVQANYRNEGYYTTGEKHDEFADFFEYFLIYPDKSTFKKFYLKENAIRKIFKEVSVQPDDYVKNPVTEESLVSMIENINEKIFRKGK